MDPNLTFEEVLKLKEKLGAKKFKKLTKDSAHDKPNKVNLKRKAHDADAPIEISSKRPVKQSLVRSVRPQRSIDPRFNPRTGNFNEDEFKKNYEFAYDLRDQELEELKKKKPASKEDNDDNNEQKKYLIQRMENQKREQQKRLRNKKPVIINKDGTKYFPSKKEIRAQELVAQFEELKKTGGLEKHLEKRRRKEAGKQRKKMNIEK